MSSRRLLLSGTIGVLLWGYASTAQATTFASQFAFLGEPDVFVPGFGLEAEIPLISSLGVWAGGAYLLSGTWDLETGIRWHLSPRFALSLQALFLFDVVDGFVPQLGAGVRWNFPLTPTGSLRFFNEVKVYVPLQERFLQPVYEAGMSVRF
jgi:hypothetical protein